MAEGERPAGSSSTTVTIAELLVLAAVLVVALAGWASLALARFGLLNVPTVAAVSLGVLALVAWRVAVARRRPAITRDLPGLLVLVALAGVSAYLFFPGFPYGIGDKDPGVYVEHAEQIARTGDLRVNDPVLDPAVVPTYQLTSPGARFPGLWVHDAAKHEVVPQFYHLYPALMATVKRIGGLGAMFDLNAVFALLSVLCLALLARRLAGWIAGAVAGALLATNMLEVWQAKYPTTEMLAQLMLVAALLAMVIAIQTRWRLPAAAAGLFIGVGWLDRADGLLLVLLAVALACVLIVLRRFNEQFAAFAIGLALVTPYALWQAYGIASKYTLTNGIPSLRKLAVLVVVPLAVAFGLQRVAGPVARRINGSLANRRLQAWVGFCLAGVAALLMLLGFFRSRFFGPDFLPYNGRLLRSYDDQSLIRLSWFVTLPGFALMGIGFAIVAMRRWRASVWLAVAPVALLLPVYAWHAKNSTRLMWWPRRFVPAVLFGMLLLMALAIAWMASRKGAWGLALKAVAAVAVAFLLASFLHESLPLRKHHEYAGSVAVVADIASLSGKKQGVYLWAYPTSCCAHPTPWLAGPLWFAQGEVSVLLPRKPSPQYVENFVHGFPGQPVFIVAPNGTVPEGLGGVSLERVRRFTATLPMWNESDVKRPSAAHQEHVDVTVWHVAGT